MANTQSGGVGIDWVNRGDPAAVDFDKNVKGGKKSLTGEARELRTWLKGFVERLKVNPGLCFKPFMRKQRDSDIDFQVTMEKFGLKADELGGD